MRIQTANFCLRTEQVSHLFEYEDLLPTSKRLSTFKLPFVI